MRTVLVVLGCLLLAACGGSADEGHLTLKLDGKPMAFNERLKAQMGGDREHLVIGGHLPDSMDSYDIELWSLGKRIEPGTYSLPAAKLISRYAIQQSKDGKGRGTTIWSAFRPDEDRLSLTIESIDDWGVEGRFSGRIQLLGGDGTAFMDVSDGSFAAPYELQNR
ncbi:hypothetical protein [Pseudomonas sp. PS02288]|uniref:hypothetical protein n=1 Tax=Pseudomonas sp. PS02288 TaxID=2991443 RepID=UPI00249CEBC4|nr:hypothetical protein [Pseudomonas sp. PS02288]